VVRSRPEEGNAGRVLNEELSRRQRQRIEAACVDMWEPFRLSIEQWAPQCRIVYDKFHIMQHANAAVDEVRRAELFRKGGRMRNLVKGKRWLPLTRWVNLSTGNKRELNTLFALNRKLLKAYLLTESLDRLWMYHYEGAMLNYLQRWIDQLRRQRLQPFQKLASMLLKHLEGILNYCRTKVPMGVVEAVNGNIKTLLRRGRGYRNPAQSSEDGSDQDRIRLSGKPRESRFPSNSHGEP
jgi:transposase